ncbi:hypothetical protein B0T26DRAFT_676323 [Lasiosphaeria miniovina]|uniref:Uncharacterized protein n=1 Tax=Lasiosphaeria miniovina TaxID=1954250 RepID=A0AA40ALP6_9PEZI|nr:uncharacterized protein B0T26DRAFT_676323 [Lasiosphaeria miniovina]KAK0718119.1 hypothetical protein B0T26DRAFT_676323 [Lasiosphaeria miniovina]
MQALSLGVTAQQKEKWRLSPSWVAVPGRSSAPNHHLPRLLAPSRVRGSGRLRLLVCLELPGASCLQLSYMYIITVASPSVPSVDAQGGKVNGPSRRFPGRSLAVNAARQR